MHRTAFYSIPGVAFIPIPPLAGWFQVNVGDRIHASITLDDEDRQSASLYLLNENNWDVMGPYPIDVGKPLSGYEAGWLVIAPKFDRSRESVKPVEFGTVVFEDISAKGFNHGLYTLADATYMLDIEQKDRTLTHTTFDNNYTSSMSISYLQ